MPRGGVADRGDDGGVPVVGGTGSAATRGIRGRAVPWALGLSRRAAGSMLRACANTISRGSPADFTG